MRAQITASEAVDVALAEVADLVPTTGIPGALAVVAGRYDVDVRKLETLWRDRFGGDGLPDVPAAD